MPVCEKCKEINYGLQRYAKYFNDVNLENKKNIEVELSSAITRSALMQGRSALVLLASLKQGYRWLWNIERKK
jgi:hypothetical protein